MRLRHTLVPLAALLQVGCYGAVFQHTVRPLTTDFTGARVVGTGPARGSVKEFRYNAIDVQWDTNAIGAVAKAAGFQEVYYADLEVLSILGVWTQTWVTVYGKPRENADAASVLRPDARDFGAPLTLTATTPLAQIVKAPERYVDDEVLLRATLSDVCQKKGCWTIARDGDASVRVRFEDYGFFLPTDSIGAEALIQGKVEVVTLSEREAKHYAAESREGGSESIEGPVRELSMVASGVRLLVPAVEPPPTDE